MFTMYDTTTPDQVPANAVAIAPYIDGDYKWSQAQIDRHPHARVLRLSATERIPADAYDVERGDHTIQSVPELYNIAHERGIWRPCFYGSLSTMEGIKAMLDSIHLNRTDYRLWVAVPNGIPHIPAGYDACQYEWRALGRNLDESLCSSTFFRPKPAAPVKRHRQIVEFDCETLGWALVPVE